MDAGLTTAEIERVIAKKGGSYFRGATLFDVYEGKQVGEGKKSQAAVLAELEELGEASRFYVGAKNTTKNGTVRFSTT